MEDSELIVYIIINIGITIIVYIRKYIVAIIDIFIKIADKIHPVWVIDEYAMIGFRRD